MKIAGEHVFAASPDVVWPMLQDPTVLANVLPGCEKLEEISPNTYEGVLKVRVGPVQGVFQGTIKLENIKATDSQNMGYDMQVEGSGPSGFVRGQGSLQLNGDNQSTSMTYEGDVQVGGRIASVGQRLLDTSARAVIRQSLEGLDRLVAAKTQVHTTGLTPSEATRISETAVPSPPSQTEFALGVAKNILDELVPPEQRGNLGAKIVLALGALLFVKWLCGRSASKNRHSDA
ncbi:MAG: hypothetical protein Kow0080_32330 [Candidatus Promineifilaceae bacterium]